MSVVIRTFFVALASAVLVAGGCNSSFRAERSLTQTTPHVDDAPLVVTTSNGSIEVIRDASAEAVRVDAVLVGRGPTPREAEDRAAMASIALTREPDGTLRVEPVFPEGRRNGEGASFVVRLPGARGVTLRTGNGGVRAEGLEGPLRVTTSNGRVTVTSHDGDATIESSNGRIEVEDLRGAFRARTSNGRVTAEGVTGPVEVDTSNGSITLALAPEASGPFELETSNGSVRVKVGPAFRGEIGVKTSNGDVDVEDPQRRASRVEVQRGRGLVSFGAEGAEASSVKTSNGNVTIEVTGGTEAEGTGA